MSEDNVDQLIEELDDELDEELDEELDDEQDTDSSEVGEVITEDLATTTGHRAQDVQHLTANDIAYAKALGLSE